MVGDADGMVVFVELELIWPCEAPFKSEKNENRIFHVLKCCWFFMEIFGPIYLEYIERERRADLLFPFSNPISGQVYYHIRLVSK